VQAVSVRECVVVLVALVAIHSLLWMHGAPLPDPDEMFYTDPAWHLAKSGALIAPADQYIDLTYATAFSFYPPGYFLLLGVWITFFGYTASTLLAFAQMLHALYLTAVWWLVRVRFGVPRSVAALVLLSCFPFYHMGRPDLVAVLFGTCAWVVYPSSGFGVRFVACAMLAGLALLTSPSFGLGAIATVVTFAAIEHGRLSGKTLRRAAILGATSVGVTLGLWAVVITWQSGWAVMPGQFLVNTRQRGAELNRLPSGFSSYMVIFSLVPLVGATLLPLLGALALRTHRGAGRPASAWTTSITYLGAFVPVFLANKAQLLYSHHFAVTARPAFHGSLASTSAPFRAIGIAALLVFTTVHFYLEKGFVVAALGPSVHYDLLDRSQLPHGGVVAVDSEYDPFLRGYYDGDLIDYTTFTTATNYWRRYRDATPSDVFARVPKSLQPGPEVPDYIVVSALGLFNDAMPSKIESSYEQVAGPAKDSQLTVFGLKMRVLRNPLALHVFRRRGSAEHHR
jgi:hypothetical protein